MSEPIVRNAGERSRWRRLLGAALVLVCVAGCGDGAASPSPSATPGGDITSVEEAVEAVIAQNEALAGIPRYEPDVIGACCWWRATDTNEGYELVFRVGWGDCPAGCINEHTWTYRVGMDGSVELVDEGGDPLPSGGVPSGGA